MLSVFLQSLPLRGPHGRSPDPADELGSGPFPKPAFFAKKTPFTKKGLLVTKKHGAHVKTYFFASRLFSFSPAARRTVARARKAGSRVQQVAVVSSRLSSRSHTRGGDFQKWARHRLTPRPLLMCPYAPDMHPPYASCFYKAGILALGFPSPPYSCILRQCGTTGGGIQNGRVYIPDVFSDRYEDRDHLF